MTGTVLKFLFRVPVDSTNNPEFSLTLIDSRLELGVAMMTFVIPRNIFGRTRIHRA